MCASYSGQEPTVLHVDDDHPQVDIVEEFLTRHLDAITVVNTTDPSEVLDHLADTNIDCVISDYDMPGTDGLDLLTEVRDEHPDLPFVLYTGKGSEEIASEAINAGVTGYLQKGGPDQLERLANRVDHAATEYRAERESERYATVLQALDYPTYVVDDNAEFSYVNDTFVEMTGYDREEIIGSPPGLIKTDEGVTEANESLRSIVSSDGPDRQAFDVDIHTKDGDIIPCRDHMAALPFDEEFRGSVGILRDISEQKAQREQLRAQNDRLEEIVSFISHDLRTPLAQAQAGVELARDSNAAEDFERVESALRRIEGMIDELRTLAETGIAVSETCEVSIEQLATRAWQTLSRDEDTLEVDSFEVEADPERTKSFVENLLRNAIEHTDPGVTVRVGTLADSESGGTASRGGFFVEDTGPGIPDEQREQIFTPGYTTAEGGTGFGLSIVSSVAESHNWELTVTESEAGGARFEIRDVTVCPAMPEETAEASSSP